MGGGRCRKAGFVDVVVRWNFKAGCEALVVVARSGQVHCKAARQGQLGRKWAGGFRRGLSFGETPWKGHACAFNVLGAASNEQNSAFVASLCVVTARLAEEGPSGGNED